MGQRQEKMAALTSRTDKQNEDRVADIEGLRTRLAADSAYMEALASKTMGVFFSAYRSVITMCHVCHAVVTHLSPGPGPTAGAGRTSPSTARTATQAAAWTWTLGCSPALSVTSRYFR